MVRQVLLGVGVMVLALVGLSVASNQDAAEKMAVLQSTAEQQKPGYGNTRQRECDVISLKIRSRARRWRPKTPMSPTCTPSAQTSRPAVNRSAESTVQSAAPSTTIRLGTWIAGPDLPRMTWGAAAVLNGKFYIVGGQMGNGTDVQVYDPDTDRWSRAADLPEGVFEQGLAVHDGALYSLGGTTSADKNWWGIPVNTAFRYDPSANTWTRLPNLPRARSDFLTCVLAGKIYCIGGANRWPNTLSTVDVYDPSTNTWSSADDMAAGRADPRGGIYNNNIVSAWGLTTPTQTDCRIFIFDPTSGVWSQSGTTADSGFGRENLFLFSNRDGMVFAGARTGRSNETWISLFHPDTGSVEYIAKAPANRFVAVGAFDPARATIYLAGGADATGNVPVFEYVKVIPAK